MTMFLQLDLSEEEMAALNQQATAAGYTVLDYIRFKLGVTPAARQVPDKREVIAPNFEMKAVTDDGQQTQLARKDSRRTGSEAAQ